MIAAGFAGPNVAVFGAEVWKPVPGYVGIYEVSNLGRVRSLKRVTHDGKKINTRILHIASIKSGNYVCLSQNGTSTTFGLGQLVLMAFVGPPIDSRMVAMCKDGDCTNVALENLQWSRRNAVNKLWRQKKAERK